MHEIFRFVIVSYSYDDDTDADSNCHYFAGNQTGAIILSYSYDNDDVTDDDCHYLPGNKMGTMTQLSQFSSVVIPAALLAVDTFFLLR